MKPELSEHFASRKPSAIRLAQIEFLKRKDKVKDINVAIGNVSLPMHPAMQERMNNLSASGSPFEHGVVKYSTTLGFKETNDAFLNIIASSGFDTSRLHSQITDGGSQAMELVIVGVCGQPGKNDYPLLLIDAAYTNYKSLAERVGRKTVSVSRKLSDDGKFTLPDVSEIEALIEKEKPRALVVIPYDNPTGHFYDKSSMIALAKLCVKHNMWMISDEAYRELFYVDDSVVSIWGITDNEVSGIEGRRISIETSSKVWNACGLRIGALISDNQEFNARAVAENTANLCPNVIGQYIFGSIAHISSKDLQKWYEKQRNYYKKMLVDMTTQVKSLLPEAIISSPDASIYSVIDVRKIVDDSFDANDFVLYCAREGKVTVDGEDLTLLVSPMAEFYSINDLSKNPGRTQMRIAYVESQENMEKVPQLFASLLEQYLAKKAVTT
ncbi:MAG: aminotransferase class I/II-fold pyridoxal phosphate-dependent enzyme [Calditrichaeota bacterium]|nr:MAG: aminotransferase class I/II-fold pyridoxal phosphate-dependent enzyme [Calditrichota bacterium]